MLLTVADVVDEAAYVPALESIGFVLEWDVTDRRAALIRQRGRQHVVAR
jgi:hypothetical protein